MLEDSTNQQLLDAWQQGDEQAATVIVRRYMVRLSALARSRLSRKLARRLDPDDVVLSAWRSFFVAAGTGRIAVPDDDNLWPLLVTLTLRKLARQARRQASQQRDVGSEVPLDVEQDWQEIVSREPSPDEAAIIIDEVESLMGQLNPTEQEILSRRLQGEAQDAIADALNCSPRTVRRSLQRIRSRLASRDSERQSGDTAGTAPHIDPVMVRQSQPGRSAADEVEGPEEQSIPFGDLVLEEMVGQGGFGKVYRARRHSTGEVVAVKFLKKQFWRDPRAVRSLLNETARVRHLSHGNIVQHFGCGRSPQGGPFLVMEFVDGGSAADWRRASHPTVQQALDCCRDIARAVAAAHVVGIIHGDLAPGNILRRSDGRCVLTDFGFAQSLQESNLAGVGGTPEFLAPEQISDAFGPLTEQTDVYGLGGLMYFLITGSPPMAGEDLPDILARVVSARPPAPISELVADVPIPIRQLVESCLEKEPANRPLSLQDVLATLSNP